MSDITEKKILKLLAEHIGVAPEDIESDDSLKDDLNMDFASISDFSEILSNEAGLSDTLDFSEVEVVSDIFELLGAEEEF